MQIQAETIRGSSRANNEDAFLISHEYGDRGEFALVSVADGMGGGSYGELASSLAVDSLASEFSSGIENGHRFEELCADILKGFSEANHKIRQLSEKLGAGWMGTTLSSMLVNGFNVFVTNIGDSRTYIIDSEGHIFFRTKDHSYAQELADAGEIKYEDVRRDYRRNELTRALGIIDEISPDSNVVKVHSGYFALLCTDGLWEYIEDNEICETVASKGKDKLSFMIRTARERGSTDDITSVLLGF
ncbi:MAG: protein phosphatase 2C domain-containing protein [Thermoplasmatales archaeon]